MYLLVVRLVEGLHNGLRLRRHLQRFGPCGGGGGGGRPRGRVLQRWRRVVDAHRDVGERDGLGLDVARRLERGNKAVKPE